MIAWLCPKPGSASGGVAFIHRLARLGNENGLPSKVMQAEAFDVWWDVAWPYDDVVDNAYVPTDADCVVIPDVMWQMVPELRNAVGRKFVFVQNSIWASQDPADYEGVDILVCSRYLANWSERVLKRKAHILSPYCSEPWRTSAKVSNRTLVISRRNTALAMVVAGVLTEAGFPVMFLTDDVPQTELANLLDSCEFYVHLAYPEGIPWMCAEAMQSGTIVVGTTGGGGVEFMFDHETAMVVQDPETGKYMGEPDPAGEYAKRVLERMTLLRADDALRTRMSQNARNWVMGRYAKERTLDQLRKVFG